MFWTSHQNNPIAQQENQLALTCAVIFFQCTRVVLVSHLMCWILLLKISCHVLLRYVRPGFFLLLLFRVQYDYNLQSNNFALFTILHNLRHSNTVHFSPYGINTLLIHPSISIYPLIYSFLHYYYNTLTLLTRKEKKLWLCPVLTCTTDNRR